MINKGDRQKIVYIRNTAAPEENQNDDQNKGIKYLKVESHKLHSIRQT